MYPLTASRLGTAGIENKLGISDHCMGDCFENSQTLYTGEWGLPSRYPPNYILALIYSLVLEKEGHMAKKGSWILSSNLLDVSTLDVDEIITNTLDS